MHKGNLRGSGSGFWVRNSTWALCRHRERLLPVKRPGCLVPNPLCEPGRPLPRVPCPSPAAGRVSASHRPVVVQPAQVLTCGASQCPVWRGCPPPRASLGRGGASPGSVGAPAWAAEWTGPAVRFSGQTWASGPWWGPEARPRVSSVPTHAVGVRSSRMGQGHREGLGAGTALHLGLAAGWEEAEVRVCRPAGVAEGSRWAFPTCVSHRDHPRTADPSRSLSGQKEGALEPSAPSSFFVI